MTRRRILHIGWLLLVFALSLGHSFFLSSYGGDVQSFQYSPCENAMGPLEWHDYWRRDDEQLPPPAAPVITTNSNEDKQYCTSRDTWFVTRPIPVSSTSFMAMATYTAAYCNMVSIYQSNNNDNNNHNNNNNNCGQPGARLECVTSSPLNDCQVVWTTLPGAVYFVVVEVDHPPKQPSTLPSVEYLFLHRLRTAGDGLPNATDLFYEQDEDTTTLENDNHNNTSSMPSNTTTDDNNNNNNDTHHRHYHDYYNNNINSTTQTNQQSEVDKVVLESQTKCHPSPIVMQDSVPIRMTNELLGNNNNDDENDDDMLYSNNNNNNNTDTTMTKTNSKNHNNHHYFLEAALTDLQCGQASPPAAPGGVWLEYTTTAETTALYFSACPNHNNHNTLSESRHVVVLTGCHHAADTLACVTSSNYDEMEVCPGGLSVEWNGVANTTYSILVYHDATTDHPDASSSSSLEDWTVTLQSAPTNDVCSMAQPIPVDTLVSGDTSLVTETLSAADIGALTALSLRLPDWMACGTAEASFSPGLWYRFRSPVDTTVSASTCTGFRDHGNDFDTQITILQQQQQPNSNNNNNDYLNYAANHCHELQCVNGNDDHVIFATAGGCQLKSSVLWQAQADTTYYIYVNGRFASSMGSFHLELTESTPPPTSAPTAVATNDACEQAQALTGTRIVQGSTMGTPVGNAPACGDASQQASPGVWYTVVGTGETLKASTCTGYYNIDSQLDSQISVFRGGCGDELECVAGNDDDASGEACASAASAVWDSFEGELYYILVHAFRSRESGPFILSVRPAPRNDFCETATELPLGEQISGTISGASVDDKEPCGLATAQSTFGVWYSITGTGNLLTVTTCSDEHDLDTQVAVYVGDCFVMECVDGNDDAILGDECGNKQSLVQWPSVEGEQYYVLVYAYGTSTGPFHLKVYEDPDATLPPVPQPTPSPTKSPIAEPENSDCTGAVGPLVWGESIESTTKGATVSDIESCDLASGQQQGPGVWFYTTAERNARLTASACSDWHSSNFRRQISVYRAENGCDGLECVEGSSSDSGSFCTVGVSITWDVVEGETYYILVQGQGFDEDGTFDLSLGEISANDACPNATPLFLDTVVSGSNLFASTDEVEACGLASFGRYPGVWFSFESPLSGIVVVSTCTSEEDAADDLDTQLSVFDGSCDDLQCVGGNDDAYDDCNFKSSVSISVVEGEMYYILMHGVYGVSIGRFNILARVGTASPTASPTAAPGNVFCEDAEEIWIGALVQGSSASSFTGEAPACGAASGQTAPGVWYKLTGNGEQIIASTCGRDGLVTSYDTQLSVFRGSNCDNLDCVDGNDDSICGTRSTVVFDSEVGETYYLLVHGYHMAGRFVLSLSASTNDG